MIYVRKLEVKEIGSLSTRKYLRGERLSIYPLRQSFLGWQQTDQFQSLDRMSTTIVKLVSILFQAELNVSAYRMIECIGGGASLLGVCF